MEIDDTKKEIIKNFLYAVKDLESTIKDYAHWKQPARAIFDRDSLRDLNDAIDEAGIEGYEIYADQQDVHLYFTKTHKTEKYPISDFEECGVKTNQYGLTEGECELIDEKIDRWGDAKIATAKLTKDQENED